MIKRCIYIAVCGLAMLMTPIFAHSQQVGRYSMYMQNFYAINPAAAGLEDHLDATLGYRKQWIGFANAPQTYFVSANAPLTKTFRNPSNSSIRISNPNRYNENLPSGRRSKHAAGVMVNVNQYGAFKYTQAYGTYAFHLPVSQKWNLSFGSNIGVNTFAIDQGLITLEIPDDNHYLEVITDAQSNSNLLDIDLGFMAYTRRIFIGYSTEQLLRNYVSFGGSSKFADLLVHHRLLLGRTFKVSRSTKVILNGFVYAIRNGVLSTELNVRADYRDQFWGGLSYRYNDAVIPMAGLYINDQIKIGYAYDFNISSLRQYLPGGSHEFMLGFMFGNKRAVF